MPQRTIFQAIARTYAFLGLPTPIAIRMDGHYGSPFCPTPVSFKAALSGLRNSALELAATLASPHPYPEYLALVKRKVIVDAAAAVLLTAHRGIMIHRWTFAAVYSSEQAIHIFDKETMASTVRIFPRTKAVKELLAAHRRDLLVMANQIRPHTEKTADRILGIAELKRPLAPAFFYPVPSKESASRINLRAVTSDEIAEELIRYGLARNAGRHFLLSYLVRWNVPAPLIRMASGHSRRAGQPFHPAAGIAPMAAIAMLRPVLDRLQHFASLDPWPSLGTQEVRGNRLTITPQERSVFNDNAIEAFIKRDKHLLGKRAEPFHPQSIAYLAFTTYLRSKLLNGAKGLAPWGAVLLSLCIVDGIASPTQLEHAWGAAAKKDGLYPIGRTFLVVFHTERGYVVPLPLQPLTSIYVDDARRAKSVRFNTALGELIDWLRDVDRSVNWNKDPSRALAELCGVAYSAATLEVPPWIQTAQNSGLDAATLSIGSIARLLHGRPLIWTRRLPKPRRRQPSMDRSKSTISHLCRIVNHWGDSTKPFGEEHERHKRLGEELYSWRESTPMPTPGADGLEVYISAESINKGALGLVLEISSLATYLSSFRDFLEKHEYEHFLEWEEGRWLEGDKHVTTNLAGDHFIRARSIFRRFARFWHSRGAMVPDEVLEYRESDSSSVPAVRASSSFISARDVSQLLAYIAGEFDAGLLLSDQAIAHTSLAAAVPMRSGEFGPIQLADLDAELQTLSITSHGFSNLKSKEVSRRAVSISKELTTRFELLRNRIADADNDSHEFFRLPMTGQERMHLERIEAAISDGLKIVTGDNDARQHSLRGSAESYLVCPDFDDVFNRLIHNECPLTPEECFDYGSWWRVVSAASMAGHHPLTAIKFYLAVWPVMAYHIRRQNSLGWRPSAGLQNRIKGLSLVNLKQLIARMSRNPQAGRDIWSVLLERLDFVSGRRLESLLAKDSGTGDNETTTADNGIPPPRNVETDLWYIACRIGNLTSNQSLDATGIDIAGAKRLDQVISHHLIMADNYNPTVQRALRGSDGSTMTAALATCMSVDDLREARTWLTPATRLGVTLPDAVVGAIQKVLTILPKHLTVSVMPEHDHEAVSIANQAAILDPDIVVKAPATSPKHRFRLQVLPRDSNRRGPRAQGDTTALFFIVANARMLQIMEDIQ